MINTRFDSAIWRDGFIRTSGQPSIESKIEFNANTKEWREIRQRSYLTGYLPGIYLEHLISFLDQQHGCIYRIWSLEKKQKLNKPKLWNRLFKKKVQPTQEMYLKLFRTSCVGYFILKVDRSASDRKKLSTVPWNYSSKFNSTFYPPKYDFDGYSSITTTLEQVNAFYLELAGTSYDLNNSVENMFLKFLNKHNI